MDIASKRSVEIELGKGAGSGSTGKNVSTGVRWNAMAKLGPRVKVVSVHVIHDFTVHIVFDNGLQREEDLTRCLDGPIFKSLRENPKVFAAMDITAGVILWPSGADIDPDVLYYGIQPAKKEAFTDVKQ
jgi:hypothetical protein